MYYSQTGNTKQLAEVIAEGVKEIDGVECVLKPISEVTRDDLLAADGIIAGTPVYFGTMAAQLKMIFENSMDICGQMCGKIGAAFVTGAHHSDGKETTILSIIQAFLIYGMIVVGNSMDASGHYGVACMDTPDVKAAKDAVKLGRRVALLVKTLNQKL